LEGDVQQLVSLFCLPTSKEVCLISFSLKKKEQDKLSNTKKEERNALPPTLQT
jgi:hypothetical protein